VVPGKFYRALVAALAGLTLAGAAAPDPTDRLDRFRELAAAQFGLAQLLESERPADAYREIWALLDDEIVESLGSGGVFASQAFLQDRLDAFAEVWGGASLRLTRVGELLVGAFVLDERSDANSVRVYGVLRGEPTLLAVFYRAGRPSLSLLPAARDGSAFVVTWEGPPSAWGSRPLRVEVLRRDGDQVRVAWSSAEVFTDGLLARGWSLRGADLRVRYELRYPGWTPGCDGQTEREDVYRLGAGGTANRVSRQDYNTWHRELGAVVDRLLAALATGDETTVRALVPDPALRTRLPAGLAFEPLCDAREGAGSDAVSVAAAADRRPWTLTFRRPGGRWRLTAARPVLQ
jgi:hypothetical protein